MGSENHVLWAEKISKFVTSVPLERGCVHQALETTGSEAALHQTNERMIEGEEAQTKAATQLSFQRRERITDRFVRRVIAVPFLDQLGPGHCLIAGRLVQPVSESIEIGNKGADRRF